MSPMTLVIVLLIVAGLACLLVNHVRDSKLKDDPYDDYGVFGDQPRVEP